MNSLKFYHEYGKDETLMDSQTRNYVDIIIPSLQLINNAIENADFLRKIDKCLEKLDEGLKIMKGVVDSEELVVDVACNYKRYFAKHNPDNLVYMFTT
mgnify:CR=1 FL=1